MEDTAMFKRIFTLSLLICSSAFGGLEFQGAVRERHAVGPDLENVVPERHAVGPDVENAIPERHAFGVSQDKELVEVRTSLDIEAIDLNEGF